MNVSLAHKQKALKDINVKITNDFYNKVMNIKEKLRYREELHTKHAAIEQRIRTLRAELVEVETELQKDGIGNTLSNLPGYNELKDDLMQEIIRQL